MPRVSRQLYRLASAVVYGTYDLASLNIFRLDLTRHYSAMTGLAQA